jgi:hypothetical protein
VSEPRPIVGELTQVGATPERPAVDNRRTFCAHCSLRQDLPGFIGREHATENKTSIESGDLFPCHMSNDPLRPEASHKICLGAALAAKVPLGNTPAGGQPDIYADLQTYADNQEAGRRDNLWLEQRADKWYDRRMVRWYGWWAQAPAGNWSYLMTTLADNANTSVYLFFDQCQQLHGPLELM